MSEANRDKGPENLADILGRLFTSRGWGRKNDRLRLESAWASAAGAEFLKDTAVLGLRRGVLEVAVRNAVLMSELAQFHKRGLLTKLRAAMPGVTLTDLKFRAAAW
jgi:predicted nucleic acid-binding Zn ribbon protein